MKSIRYVFFVQSKNVMYATRCQYSCTKAESTVNEGVRRRFCKKQSMQWSKEGAHLLFQTRVRTLNGELSAMFKRWYPGMNLKAEESLLAA